MIDGIFCSMVYIIRPHHSTVYVDAAYCYRPSNVVCQSVTVMSPAKTAESVEMPFGLWTWVGPRNCVRWGSYSTMGKGNFWGESGGVL